MVYSPIERSSADIVAAFPPKTTTIAGRPNLHELLRVLKYLCRCSQTTKSCLGPLGYLFVALPLRHYQRYTIVPLNLPGPTPDIPNYPPNADKATIDQMKINWQAHKNENNNIQNMNEALTATFLSLLPSAYTKHLENDLVGRTTSNFWTIFSSFLTKYGVVKPMDIENNNVRMKAPYDPTTPIENLFGQINDANEYAIFANSPLSDSTLVNAGEVLILRTNAFAIEYQTWRKIIITNRTWARFQQYWQEAYDLKEETETTAASMGYSANVEDDGAAYEATVENFGTAFAANSNAFATLTESNQHLGQNVAANVVDLQSQIQNLTQLVHSMAAAAARPATQFIQHPPPAQYQHQQPPQQQYNNFVQGENGGGNMQGGRGFHMQNGRGAQQAGGRGRQQQRTNYGRGNGYGNQRSGRGYQNQNQQQQQFRQIPGYKSNTTKTYNDNDNYCWTHGHDLPSWHHSGTCNHPFQQHVWTATKFNTCNGSTKGEHKIRNYNANNNQY